MDSDSDSDNIDIASALLGGATKNKSSRKVSSTSRPSSTTTTTTTNSSKKGKNTQRHQQQEEEEVEDVDDDSDDEIFASLSQLQHSRNLSEGAQDTLEQYRLLAIENEVNQRRSIEQSELLLFAPSLTKADTVFAPLGAMDAKKSQYELRLLELFKTPEPELSNFRAAIDRCDHTRRHHWSLLQRYGQELHQDAQQWETEVERGLESADELLTECERISEQLSRYVVDLVLEWKRNKKEDAVF